jgi:biotin operon repressor
MNYNERKKRLGYLLELIEKGQCISTNQMAQKFNCSKRTVKRLIDELRIEGYDIQYCTSIKKFHVK